MTSADRLAQLEEVVAQPPITWVKKDGREQQLSSSNDIKEYISHVDNEISGLARLGFADGNSDKQKNFARLKQKWIQDMKPSIIKGLQRIENQELIGSGKVREKSEEEQRQMLEQGLEDTIMHVQNTIDQEDVLKRGMDNIDDKTNALGRSMDGARKAMNDLAKQTANDRRYFLGGFACYCLVCIHIILRRLHIYKAIYISIYYFIWPVMEPIYYVVYYALEPIFDMIGPMLNEILFQIMGEPGGGVGTVNVVERGPLPASGAFGDL